MTILAIIVCLLLLIRYAFVLIKYLRTGVFRRKAVGKHASIKVIGYSCMMFAFIFFLIFLAINTELYEKNGTSNSLLLILFLIPLILGLISFFLYFFYSINAYDTEEKPIEQQKQSREDFLEITRIISDGDSAVMDAVKSLPKNYTCNDLMSCLEKSGYVCKFDYKAEVKLEDFIRSIDKLGHKAEFNKKSLDEKADIWEWIKILDLELLPKNMRVGYIYDTDSLYCSVFFCSKDKAKSLTNASDKVRFANSEEIKKFYKIEFPFRGVLGEDADDYISSKDVYSHLEPTEIYDIEDSWAESELSQYINNDKLKNKIIDMTLSLKSNGVCHIIIGTSDELTDEEKDSLKDFITGQVADGWGEDGYDFTYAKEDGGSIPCSVEFWWNDSSWYIKYL